MFKIKLSTVLSIAAGAGVVVTGFLAARGGRKAAKIEFEAMEKAVAENISNGNLDIVTSDNDDEILDEIAKEVNRGTRKARFKAYIPAIVSGVVTLGCGAYAKRLDTKEIIKLSAALGALSTRFRNLSQYFSVYRDEVSNEVGPEKEKEIRERVGTKLVKSGLNGIEEGEYVFHIDWVGGRDIYFKATSSDVMFGMSEMNRLLNDCYGNDPHAGCPSVTDFFYCIGQPEIADEETDAACWTEDECVEMDQWWIHWEILPYGRQDFADETAEYYDISIDMYPNGCIENKQLNLERAGTM